MSAWEGEAKEAVLLLMAVIQLIKNKVRHVLDVRELTEYVLCNTGGNVIGVCAENGVTTLADLKSA